MNKYRIEQIASECIRFIETRTKELGGRGITVSLSGGIDSATTLYLCRDSMGKSRVNALLMPCNIRDEGLVTMESETKDGILVAESAGVDYRVIDISEGALEFIRRFSVKNNSKALRENANGLLVQRARCLAQSYFAEQVVYITAGSGNHTDWAYEFVPGTSFADIYPIGALFKSAVFELAEHLGVPRKIIDKPPHSGFVGDSSDEEIYGATISQLDDLYYLWRWHEKDLETISRMINLSVPKIKSLIDIIKRTHLSDYEPTWANLEIHSQFPHLEEKLGGPFKPTYSGYAS